MPVRDPPQIADFAAGAGESRIGGPRADSAEAVPGSLLYMRPLIARILNEVPWMGMVLKF